MKETKESISQIKDKFAAAQWDVLAEMIQEYEQDTRSGVQKLILSARRKIEKYEQELRRMEQMKHYERQYAAYSCIAGIDEVGRGPLAGPVVTCAVILPKDCDLLYINDSKKLSAAMREKLCEQIKECAVAYEIGMADHHVIDDINILQATYQAMRQAVNNLAVSPDLLLNDAVRIPDITIEQVPIIKGDAKSISIAAASIVAKVTRDAMMDAYDQIYPEYDFIHNKGYGSPKHIEALKKYGPCPIHRKTFIKNFISKH